MSNTPNMGMVLPVVSSTPGPLYAAENNQAFLVLDAHDHTAGNGLPVPTSGMNINGDLPFNSFNASLLRSTRFDNQGSPLSLPADIRSLYVSGGNLYYNNGVGQAIQLTAGVALNATSIGGIGGDYATSTASEFYTSLSSTFTFWSATNVPAAIDSGPITLRTITTSPFGITINSPGSLSADYSLTLFNSLPPAGNTRFVTVNDSGQLADTIVYPLTGTDIASGTITTTNIASNTILNGNIANGTIQNAKFAAANYFVSTATGNPTTLATSASPAAITQLAGTLTTVGRPVRIQVQSAGGGARAFITPGTANIIFMLYIDGVEAYSEILQQTNAFQIPTTIYNWFIPGLSAGAHTFAIFYISTANWDINLATLVGQEV